MSLPLELAGDTKVRLAGGLIDPLLLLRRAAQQLDLLVVATDESVLDLDQMKLLFIHQGLILVEFLLLLLDFLLVVLEALTILLAPFLDFAELLRLAVE